MTRLLKRVQFSKRLIEQQSRLWRWSQHFLGFNSALFLYCISPASAAETVVLQYTDRQVTVSLTELKAFVEMGETTPILQEFIQRVPTDQVFERQLFSDNLPLRFEPSGDPTISRNAQFILYQINKLVGKPPGEENYPALRTALIEASRGRGLTLLRLIEAYPEEAVRVELRDLERVYHDINLFIERIQPLVQSRQLIEDWLCECVPGNQSPNDDSPTVETAHQSVNELKATEKASSRCRATHALSSAAPNRILASTALNRTALASAVANTVASTGASTISGSRDSGLPEWANLSDVSAAETANLQADLQTAAPFLLALNELSQTPAAVTPVAQSAPKPSTDSAATLPAPSHRRLVVTFGPLGRSIAIDDLAHFAETGETTRQLRSYLRLANLEPTDLRALLNRQVKVDLQLVDRLLRNLLGEYVLFQASEIIHTRSRRADILAMRSAIILALQDDQQISPIEFLQRYPTQQVYVDGVALLKVARFVRRTQQNVGDVTNEVGDWLVDVQSAIAADICGCETVPPPSQVD